MTEEQKRARKESAANGNIKWIKDNCLRTKDGQDDYVFISYKSDDYKKVLDDIVYNTCKKYGLRVYFDTAFDDGSSSWIEQYYENMSDTKCKAFIAFIDDAYYSSYATLLEVMSRKTRAAGGDYNPDSLFFLPINLGKITSVINGANTGLGTRKFANGVINIHAKLELEKFNEIFSEIIEDDKKNLTVLRNIYKGENYSQLYEEKTDTEPAYGKMYLSITQCRKIMEKVLPNSNENDGTNKDFVEVIHDKLINAGLSSVFEKREKAPEKVSGTSEAALTSEKETEPVNGITAPIPLGGQKAKNNSEYHPAPAGNLISPVSDSVPGQVREWTYSTKKGANAHILWDGSSKNCKVLKESVAAKESDKFATSVPAAKKLKDQLVSQGILNGLTFIEDYECDKIATMINLLNGGSVSMPAEIKGRNLVLIEDGGNSANDISLNAGTDREASVPEPETLAETDSQPSGECVYIYKNARIRCDLNANVCTVLKGSRTQGESPKFATNAQGAKKLKEELKQKRIIENDVFLEDYTDSMAKLLNLINGGSVSAPREKMKFKREN